MGIYDSYGNKGGQLKVASDACLRHFNVGDEVNIPDGVYLTYVNVIVILDSVFIAEFETLASKWGEPIEPCTFLEQTWLGEVLEYKNITHLYLSLRREIEYRLQHMGFNVSNVMARIPIQAFWTALEAVNDAADRQSRT